MSEANLRQIRVLHIVSAGGIASSLQPSLFMPLLTRLPRQRVKAQVACLSPGAVPSAVLRQNGVPTFDLALSRKRFSPKAFNELQQSARHFRPDVIQAWGHTAQVIAALLRKRCEWKPRLVWSLSDTAPLAKNAGFFDRQKLKYAAKFASSADRIVYTSEAAAAQHRRVGFPDGGHETVPPGVDATRFKPDFAARRKLRGELSLPGETFVVGMVAPVQPEFDHATLLKAFGELVKVNPNIALVLAGHGVQKGNAPLMALVGGGALATRVHLLGEWSDVSALYNACDVVCSSAVNDQSRMNVVMAMLCGVPCVATGIGAQGEVIGQHGVAIEPGNPAAFVKGITRVMQLSPEKRTHMAQGARKHALANYVYVRSLQKYLQLYYDLIGRQSLVTNDLPTPEIDAALTVPPALPSEAEMNAVKRKPITVVDLSDPDSLESKVTERTPEELPKWRIEQEEERTKREAELAAKVAASQSVGDVLQVFESEQAKSAASESPMTERARGVADDSEELLSPELLAAEAPPPPRVSHGPSGSKKSSSAAPTPAASAPAQDAAKQAALKAARMAALQPIAPPSRPVAAPKASAAVTKPPVTRAAASSPVTRPPASPAQTRPPAAASATPQASIEASKPATAAAIAATNTACPDIGSTQPLEMLPELDLLASIESQPLTANISSSADAELAKVDLGGTQPLEALPEIDLLASIESPPVAPTVSSSAGTESVNVDLGGTQPLEMLPEIDLLASVAPDASPATEPDVSTPVVTERKLSAAAAVPEKADPASPQALGPFAQALMNATLRMAAFKVDRSQSQSPEPSARVQTPSSAASITETSTTAATATAVRASVLKAAAATEKMSAVEVSAAAEKASKVATVEATPVANKAGAEQSVAAKAPTKSAQDFSELALLATGEWMAMQWPGTRSESKASETKSGELSGAETLSLISNHALDAKSEASADPAVQLALVPDPAVEPKRAANGK